MKYIILFGITVAPIFNDLPFAEYFGEFGRSLPLLMFPVYFLYTIINYRILNSYKNASRFIMIIIFFSILSMLMSSLIYFLNVGNIILRGENVIIKNIKLLTYLFANICYLSTLLIFIKNHTYEVLKTLYYMNFLLLIILFIELFNPNMLNILHFNKNNYRVPRLLSSEPSWTSYMLNAYFIGGAFYLKKFYNKLNSKHILLVLAFLIQLYFTTSKMFLLFGRINIIIYFYFLIGTKRRKFLKNSLFIIVVILILLITLPNLVTSTLNDIQNFSSFSTRLGTMIASVYQPFLYPFSSGAVYLYYFPKSIDYFLYNSVFSDLWSNFNLYEITNYIVSQEENAMVAKSGFLSFYQYYGIVTLILVFIILFKILKKIKKNYFYSSFFVINLLIVPFFDGIITRQFFCLLLGIYIFFSFYHENNEQLRIDT